MNGDRSPFLLFFPFSTQNANGFFQGGVLRFNKKCTKQQGPQFRHLMCILIDCPYLKNPIVIYIYPHMGPYTSYVDKEGVSPYSNVNFTTLTYLDM